MPKLKEYSNSAEAIAEINGATIVECTSKLRGDENKDETTGEQKTVTYDAVSYNTLEAAIEHVGEAQLVAWANAAQKAGARQIALKPEGPKVRDLTSKFKGLSPKVRAALLEKMAANLDDELAALLDDDTE